MPAPPEPADSLGADLEPDGGEVSGDHLPGAAKLSHLPDQVFVFGQARHRSFSGRFASHFIFERLQELCSLLWGHGWVRKAFERCFKRRFVRVLQTLSEVLRTPSTSIGASYTKNLEAG